jgi:hypothetical protein
MFMQHQAISKIFALFPAAWWCGFGDVIYEDRHEVIS